MKDIDKRKIQKEINSNFAELASALTEKQSEIILESVVSWLEDPKFFWGDHLFMLARVKIDKVNKSFLKEEEPELSKDQLKMLCFLFRGMIESLRPRKTNLD